MDHPVGHAAQGHQGAGLEDHPLRHLGEPGGDPLAVAVGEFLGEADIGALGNAEHDLAGRVGDAQRDPFGRRTALEGHLEGLAPVKNLEMRRVRRNAAEQGGFHVRNLPRYVDSVSAAVCRSQERIENALRLLTPSSERVLDGDSQ
jgi:hypothetical protein